MIELQVYWMDYDADAQKLEEDLGITLSKEEKEEEIRLRPMTFLNIDNFYPYEGNAEDIKIPATVIVTSGREYIANIAYQDLKDLIHP